MVDEEIQSYNRRYYLQKKAQILRKRRERYRVDKDYRERLRESARDTYAAKRKEQGRDVYKFGTPVKGRSVVEKDGQIYYAASYAAQQAGVSQSTLRRWERDGVIPKATKEESGRRWRWYLPAQVLLLKQLAHFKRMNKKQKMAASLHVKARWKIDYEKEKQRKKSRGVQAEVREINGEGIDELLAGKKRVRGGK